MFQKKLNFKNKFLPPYPTRRDDHFSYEHFSDPTKYEKLIPENPKIRVLFGRTLVNLSSLAHHDVVFIFQLFYGIDTEEVVA